MDEPARFSRVLLRFLSGTQPAPMDRAALRERQKARSAQDAQSRDAVEA